MEKGCSGPKFSGGGTAAEAPEAPRHRLEALGAPPGAGRTARGRGELAPARAKICAGLASAQKGGTSPPARLEPGLPGRRKFCGALGEGSGGKGKAARGLWRSAAATTVAHWLPILTIFG